ncbi:MAG: OmpH family outer membrane protein [Sphingomonadales bacterium]|nr:OmpH family outer membrane protein [Sphingomonadales bacterium]
MQTTYAGQMQQAEARAQALQTELLPLQQAYQQALQAPGATAESVRPAGEALQQRRATAQQEINQLQAPYLNAIAYVREQLMAQIEAPVQAAMAAANVDLVVQPEAVLSMAPNSPANLTAAVTAQLNSRVSSVSATPPAGWQQGDTLRAAQQQQQPAPQPNPGR